jgi:hypothetical protein
VSKTPLARIVLSGDQVVVVFPKRRDGGLAQLGGSLLDRQTLTVIIGDAVAIGS